jgi:hypothetical protein
VGGWWCSWNISTPPLKKQRNKQQQQKETVLVNKRTTGNVPELKEGYIAAVHSGTVNSLGSHSPPASKYFAGRN